MVLRNVPKTDTFEQQRIEINEIAADLHSLNQTVASFSLNDLVDVTASGAAIQQIIKYNGTAWVLDTDIVSTSFSVQTNAASGGGALSYNNSTAIFQYTPPDLSGFLTSLGSIGGHTDVDVTGAANGKILKYNGTNWVVADDASGGGADGNTTYTQSAVSGSGDVKLRLTGSDSTNDDITITAGNNISISSVTADGFTLSSTATSGASVTTSDSAPGSPNDGDLWWKSDEGRLKVYYEDADTSQWVDASPPLAATGGATVTTSDSAPSSPSDGDLWWKSDEGRLKVYYQDADSIQWVDASPIQTPTNITQTTTNGTNALTVTTSTTGFNANAIEIRTDNNTASAVRWRFTPPGHFIPFANAAYDIGNAEYKVRHLFLSDNTVYFQGNFLKVAQHDAGGGAQAPSYLIPLSKLKDALNASADYEAFKAAILAITDA